MISSMSLTDSVVQTLGYFIRDGKKKKQQIT